MEARRRKEKKCANGYIYTSGNEQRNTVRRRAMREKIISILVYTAMRYILSIFHIFKNYKHLLVLVSKASHSYSMDGPTRIWHAAIYAIYILHADCDEGNRQAPIFADQRHTEGTVT